MSSLQVSIFLRHKNKINLIFAKIPKMFETRYVEGRRQVG